MRGVGSRITKINVHYQAAGYVDLLCEFLEGVWRIAKLQMFVDPLLVDELLSSKRFQDMMPLLHLDYLAFYAPACYVYGKKLMFLLDSNTLVKLVLGMNIVVSAGLLSFIRSRRRIRFLDLSLVLSESNHSDESAEIKSEFLRMYDAMGEACTIHIRWITNADLLPFYRKVRNTQIFSLPHLTMRVARVDNSGKRPVVAETHIMRCTERAHFKRVDAVYEERFQFRRIILYLSLTENVLHAGVVGRVEKFILADEKNW